MADPIQTKRFFITANSNIELMELLGNHLPSKYNQDIVISSGGVWKNRQRVMNPKDVIKEGETIKVHVSTLQGKTYILPEDDIIFENNNFMVVYKPCSLNVHSVPATLYYDLTYGVNQYLQSKGLQYRSTPVTRLDRPVEGLVIFPKNKKSEIYLFQLIKQRKIYKWYMAALEGKDSFACKRIKDKITNWGNRTFNDENGKNADSLFLRLPKIEKIDFYSVFLFTGRRHQIRFHASYYFGPILGDKSYGSKINLAPDEIALICRGYNIPFKQKRYKIRLSTHHLDKFYKKIEAIQFQKIKKRDSII